MGRAETLATISDQVDACQLTEMSSFVSGKVLKKMRKGRRDFKSVSGSGCYLCEVLKVHETEGAFVKYLEVEAGTGLVSRLSERMTSQE
jgi:hypothetical protein